MEIPILSFCARRKDERKGAPAIFALRVPKASLKKAVAALQLVAFFLSDALANLEGGQKNHLFVRSQLFNPPLDICRDNHTQMSKAAGPRSFVHVQVREPEGLRGLGAAFLASFFVAKERREPIYMEALNLSCLVLYLDDLSVNRPVPHCDKPFVHRHSHSGHQEGPQMSPHPRR
jgi:hypothetical protein